MVKGMFDRKTKTRTPETMAELAAFAHHLSLREVDWELATEPFANEARQDLARVSRTAVDAFLDEVAETEGAAAGLWILRYIQSLPDRKVDELPDNEFDQGVTVDITHKAFLHFAHEEGFGGGRLPAKDQFGLAWKARFGQRWAKIRRSAQPRAYLFAGLHTARFN